MTDARSGLGLDHGKGQPTINSASVGKQKLTRLFLKRNGTRPTAHHPQGTWRPVDVPPCGGLLAHRGCYVLLTGQKAWRRPPGFRTIQVCPKDLPSPVG